MLNIRRIFMKKKGLLISLIAVIVFFAVFTTACQRQGGAAAATEITVRLLTDATGIDDKSFNAAAWRGILEFYGDTWNNTPKRGAYYDVITAQTQDMYIPNLRQATDEGYDLIAATGFTWADSVNRVARDNSNQKYMIIDVGW